MDWVFSIRFDFRVQYIVVCGIIPLVLSSFLLLQYTDAMGVCSFFLCCFGTFALVSGLFGNMESTGAWFLVGGGAMLVASGICFLASSSGALVRAIASVVIELTAKARNKSRSGSSNMQGINAEIERMQKDENGDTTPVTKGPFLKRYKARIIELVRFGGSAVVLFISGVMLTGLVRLSDLSGEYNAVEHAVFDSPFTWLFYIIAAVLIIQSIIHFIAFIILLIPKGEWFLKKVKTLVQALTLKLAFMVLTLIFTPIIATLVTSFHCQSFICPAGTFPRERYLSDYKRHLPDNTTMLSPLYFPYQSLTTAQKSSISENVWTPFGETNRMDHWFYDVTICVPCDYNQTAPAQYTCGYNNGVMVDGLKQFQTCPYQNVSLLQTDHTVQCGTMQSFYMWGSAVLMIIWCVGVPALMLMLIFIAIRYMEMIPSEVKDMEKENLSILDKVGDKIDTAQTKFWSVVLFKKFWPEKFVNFIHSDYNPIYYPVLKLMDGVIFLLRRMAKIEALALRRNSNENTIKKKTILYGISDSVHALRCALQNSLRRDAAKIWFYRVGLLKNDLKELFCNYEFRTRFFYVWDLLLKIFLTVVAAALINYPAIAVSIMTVTHLIIVLTWFFVQPYLIFFEDVISFALAVVTLINHIYALLNVFIEIPWWLYFLLIFNIIGPVLSVIAMVLFFCLRNAKNNIKKSDSRYKAAKDDVEEADRTITHVSVRMLNSFFFFVAVVTVIILGFCLVGLSRDQPTIVPAASKGLYTVNSCNAREKLEFAGYGWWTSFTDSCCCQADPYFDNKIWDPKEKGYRLVEIWHCDNGLKKLRLREAEIDGEVKSGLQLRDFCSSTFKTGVSLVTDQCKDDSNEQVYYAWNGTATIEYENKYLW
eukprot:CAMPEP_0117439950 /NCGR_PEP_ID=MMETSP0759-20121206/2825_1 /TAXON_ID=63605 /ORGANISM="Percolomonas cosmopolitus, Strain WS" /LENGTH=874 /DNA_ID=CAMNT_0005231673 /DNA_START=264 /DNA_END=2888 /DNA_ORIENTATION=+